MKQTNETKQMVADLAETIIDTSKDLNNILASGKVQFCFRSHYVDTKNDVHGIEQLIYAILKANGSVFPSRSEDGNFSKVVKAGSMFFADIENEVHKAFGFERYPATTLRVYLAGKAKNVHRIQLTGEEDQGRICPKPRAKYYFAE
jgi:hypothetical protein